MLHTEDSNYLKSCRFGPKSPYCPIFHLGSVVSWTGSDFQEIALQVGGVRSGSPLWGPQGSGPGLSNEGVWGVTHGVRWPCKVICPRDFLFSEFTVTHSQLCLRSDLGHLVRGILGTCPLVLSRWGSG